MDVSENRGTPKSSILIGFFIINHPFEKKKDMAKFHQFERLFSRVGLDSASCRYDVRYFISST